MRYFFLDTRVAVSRNQLVGHPRIIKFESGTLPFINKPTYDSVNELVKHDQGYKQFKKQNNNVAKIILWERHILFMKDLVFVNPKYDVKNLNYNILRHTMEGNRKAHEFTGMHHIGFPLPEWIVDFKIIELENEQGVYTATFLMKDETGKILSKENYSTLFPKNWTRQQVYNECIYAYENKVSIGGSEIEFKSKTTSGIPVEILLDEQGMLKTIYPTTKSIPI